MDFGDAPNTAPSLGNKENEPLEEEQEGLSGLLGEQAKRVEKIQSNLDAFPEVQNRASTSSETKSDRPGGLGGLEIGRSRLAWDSWRTRYNNKVDSPDATLGQGNEMPRDKHGEAIERDTENDRTKCHKGISGVEESDSSEVAKQKVDEFKKALERLTVEMGLDPSKDPLPQLNDKLKEDKINKTTENRDKIRSVLRESYSEQEIEDIFARFENKETQQDIEMVRIGEWMLRVNDEDPELFGKMMRAKDIDAFIEEHKKESAALREFWRDQQRVNELNEKYQQAVQLEHAESALQEAAPGALSAATTVLLLEFGVNSDVLSQLPPEGVSAVESVVGRGGGRMLGALLANGVSLDSEAFTGQVSGQFVSLDFAEGDLFLTGENAADRGNQSEYRIDPPTPAGFEKVLIHSIGEQNRMPFIANHGAQARAMYEEFAGSTEDEALPRQEGIDGFRNFLVLLIGEGGPGEAEEEERLRDLGILDAHGTVNRSRMQLFRQALEKYVPNGLVMHEGESPVTGSPESPSFAFEDAMTLAALWDGDVRRMPDDINELKKLTKIRLTGGDIYSAQHV